MDIKRALLYIALAAVATMLWSQWKQEHPTQLPSASPAVESVASPSESSSDEGRYMPSAASPTEKQSSPVGAKPIASSKGSIVTVKTDVMQVGINLKTGDLVHAQLPQYTVSLDQPDQPVQILSNTSGALFEMQSGVISTNTQHMPMQFHADKTYYELKPGQESLEVNLTATSNGITITKSYQFFKGKYQGSLKTTVTNHGSQDWTGQWFQQITRQNVPSSTHHIRSYDGAAISSHKTPYEKISFSSMDKAPLHQSIAGGWVAMQQPYFVSAWVPHSAPTYDYYSHVTTPQNGGANLYTIGYVSQPLTVAAGKSHEQTSQLYIGPEIAKDLAPVSPALKLTIDYGWLSPVSSIIFSVMNNIHHVVGNWGWSIVLVTLFIKLLFYWPSAQSYKSMAKMRKVQPRLLALKERFGDDKAGLSKATMEFYRKEKVNPMGGCLPMIIQIPVFFALYYVLIESVELRQAPFILWIHDLSIKDPYYVLPLLMGISMFLQQKLSPAPPDPTQAKMMMLMPVVFTVVFLSFPAGLVLYWLTNNLLSIGQQWYVMKTFDDKKKQKK